jgi:hypothetical protein
MAGAHTFDSDDWAKILRVAREVFHGVIGNPAVVRYYKEEENRTRSLSGTQGLMLQLLSSGRNPFCLH